MIGINTLTLWINILNRENEIIIRKYSDETYETSHEYGFAEGDDIDSESYTTLM